MTDRRASVVRASDVVRAAAPSAGPAEPVVFARWKPPRESGDGVSFVGMGRPESFGESVEHQYVLAAAHADGEWYVLFWDPGTGALLDIEDVGHEGSYDAAAEAASRALAARGIPAPDFASARGEVEEAARRREEERAAPRPTRQKRRPARIGEDEAERIVERMKSELGTTSSFGDAGYILADGTLLDFSEGGGSGRSMDHRWVESCMPTRWRRWTDDSVPGGGGGRTELMRVFMAATGAIRLHVANRYALLDFEAEPTDMQLRTIRDLLRVGRVEQVAVSPPGSTGTMEVEGWPPTAADVERALRRRRAWRGGWEREAAITVTAADLVGNRTRVAGLEALADPLVAPQVYALDPRVRPMHQQLVELHQAAEAAYEAGDLDRAEDLDVEAAELEAGLDVFLSELQESEHGADWEVGTGSGGEEELLRELASRWSWYRDGDPSRTGEPSEALASARYAIQAYGGTPGTDAEVLAAMQDAYERLSALHSRPRQAVFKPRPQQQQLIEHARRFDDFEDFSNAWSNQQLRGQYWHLTDRPDFEIDPDYRPSDVPGGFAGGRSPGAGGLMVTTHPQQWTERALGHRPYAAEIDLSGLQYGKDFVSVGRGYDEFAVLHPERARVVRVVPRERAMQSYYRFHRLGPQSKDELREVWEYAHGRREATRSVTAAIEDRIRVLQERYPSVEVAGLVQLDPTANGAYLTWLAREAAAGRLVGDERDLLIRYDDLKRRRLLPPHIRDIGQLQADQLEAVVLEAEWAEGEQAQEIVHARDVELYERRRRLQEEAAERAKALAPNGRGRKWVGVAGGYGFTEVTTREAMVEEGDKAGGNWCVGYPHTDSHWKRYMEDWEYGPDPHLYVVTGEGGPYLLFLSSTNIELKDRRDGAVEPATRRAEIVRAASEVLGVDLEEKMDEGALEALREEAQDTSTTPERLAELANNPDEIVRGEVARNTSTPVEVMSVLASDPDVGVRRGIARNTSTPVEVLSVLASDPDVGVRGEVARNTNTTPERLAELANDPNEGVRWEVVRNTSTPAEVMSVLASDPDVGVRRGIARNTSTPVEVLSVLANDPNEGVRWEVVRNTSTPAEVMSVLASDPDVGVRWEVARNTNTTPERLAELANNPDEIVRRAAKTTLERLSATVTVTAADLRSTELRLVPLDEAHARTLGWLPDDLSQHFTVVDSGGDKLGYVGLFDTEDEHDLMNVAVEPAHRGRGLARQFKELLLDHLGLDSYISVINHDNLPSLRSMEKTPGATRTSDSEYEQTFGKQRFEVRRPRRAAAGRAQYTFAWHCPSPPDELEEEARAASDGWGIVDWINDHAEAIDPDEFAEQVGGWEAVAADSWGGGWQRELEQEGLEAAAEFMRKDWSVSWYRSSYPDGTPVLFHNLGGIEHVYEPAGYQRQGARTWPYGEAAGSDEGYAIIDEHGLGDTWTAGGCHTMAEALQQRLGGELVQLRDANGVVQHAAVRIGDRVLDADGAQSELQFLRRWARELGFGIENPDDLEELQQWVWLEPFDLDEFTAAGNIVAPSRAVQSLTALFDRFMGSWRQGMRRRAYGEAREDAVAQLTQLARESSTFDDFRARVQQAHLTDLSSQEFRFGRAFPMWASEQPAPSVEDVRADAQYLEDVRVSYPSIYRAIVSASPSIWVYRAVPVRYARQGIRVGDYVALDYDYAKMHGRSVLTGEQGEKYRVVKARVPKKDVVWGEADWSEWAYAPQALRSQVGTLEDFYRRAHEVEPRALEFEEDQQADTAEPRQERQPRRQAAASYTEQFFEDRTAARDHGWEAEQAAREAWELRGDEQVGWLLGEETGGATLNSSVVIEQYSKSGGGRLLAHDGSDLVGYVQYWTPLDQTTGEELEGPPFIFELWVAPEYREGRLVPHLVDYYRVHVNPHVVMAGPFSAEGRRAADRYADEVFATDKGYQEALARRQRAGRQAAGGSQVTFELLCGQRGVNWQEALDNAARAEEVTRDLGGRLRQSETTDGEYVDSYLDVSSASAAEALDALRDAGVEVHYQDDRRIAAVQGAQWQDVRDAIEHVGWTFLNDEDFGNLMPEDFELVDVRSMTVEELADYAGLDLSSGYMMTDPEEAAAYGDLPAYLEEAGSGSDRDFSHAVEQLRGGGLAPVVVIEEGGQQYFGDGWGRVNIAHATGTPLTVATYRRMGQRRDAACPVTAAVSPFGEQEFGDGRHTYSVKALYSWAQAHLPVEDVPVASLEQAFEGTQAAEPTGSAEFAERAEAADVSYPILVVDYPDEGRWIADGMHRLWRAVRSGAQTIRGYIIPADDLPDEARTDREATVTVTAAAAALTGRDAQRVARLIRDWQGQVHDISDTAYWAARFEKLEDVLAKTRPGRPVQLFRSEPTNDPEQYAQRFTAWSPSFDAVAGFGWGDRRMVSAVFRPESIVFDIGAFAHLDRDAMHEIIVRPGNYQVVPWPGHFEGRTPRQPPPRPDAPVTQDDEAMREELSALLAEVYGIQRGKEEQARQAIAALSSQELANQIELLQERRPGRRVRRAATAQLPEGWSINVKEHDGAESGSGPTVTFELRDDEGRLQGYLRISDQERDGSWSVATRWVRESLRGAGFGNLLQNHAVEFVTAGGGTLEPSAQVTTEAAQRVWESTGRNTAYEKLDSEKGWKSPVRRGGSESTIDAWVLPAAKLPEPMLRGGAVVVTAADLDKTAMPMKTEADLPEGWQFYLWSEGEEGEPQSIHVRLYDADGGVEGRLDARAEPLGDFEVGFVHTNHDGFGPRLYELAMEEASRLGAALRPRDDPSREAREVWRRFEDRVKDPDDSVRRNERGLYKHLRQREAARPVTAAAEDVQRLKNYLTSRPLDLANFWPYVTPDMLEQAGIDEEEWERLADELDDEFYAAVERIEQAMTPRQRDEFVSHVMQRLPEEAPSWAYLDDPRWVQGNVWLVHFTDHADDIASEGFTRGVDDPTQVGLTTYLPESAKKYGGYTFAFVADSRDAAYVAREGKYGREAVMFRSLGVRAYHSGDEENQVTVWGPDVPPGSIVPLTHGENAQWSVRRRDDGRVIYESDDFGDVVGWVEANETQYRRLLFAARSVTAAIEDRIRVLQERYPSVEVAGLVQLDPTSNGAYLTWLAREAAADRLTGDERDLLARYDDLKRRRLLPPDIRDIGQLQVGSLEEAVLEAEWAAGGRAQEEVHARDVELYERRQRLREEAAERARKLAPSGEGRRRIGTAGGFGFTEILTREAMIEEGDKAGGRWCVGYACSDSHWGRYMREKQYGPDPHLYVVTGAGGPYLLFLSSTNVELRDARDEVPSRETYERLMAAAREVLGFGERRDESADERWIEEAWETRDPARLYELAHSVLSDVRRNVARHSHTPSEALAELAKDSVRGVRVSVAENPVTPSEVLAELAKDEAESVRWFVARHSHTPSEALAELAKDSVRGVRVSVAENPVTPSEVLAELAKDEAESVRRNVARHSHTPSEALAELAKDSAMGVRVSVAENPVTPSEVLAELAKDSAGGVRVSVAENPVTPSEVLAELVRSGLLVVMMPAAENPNTPPEALTELAKSRSVNVRELAAQNPRTPPEVLAELARDEAEHVAVRRSVAGNPSTPPEVLAELARDKYQWTVRQYVAGNPRTPPEVLAELAEEEVWAWGVRDAVARNPHTPPEVLAELAKDKDARVRGGAELTIRQNSGRQAAVVRCDDVCREAFTVVTAADLMRHEAAEKKVEYLKKQHPKAADMIDWLAAHDPTAPKYEALPVMWEAVKTRLPMNVVEMTDLFYATQPYAEWVQQRMRETGHRVAPSLAQFFTRAPLRDREEEHRENIVRRLPALRGAAKIGAGFKDPALGAYVRRELERAITQDDRWSVAQPVLARLIKSVPLGEDAGDNKVAVRNAIELILHNRWLVKEKKPKTIEELRGLGETGVFGENRSEGAVDHGRGVTEYTSHEAAHAECGKDTVWCWAWPSTGYWETYIQNNRLFRVDIPSAPDGPFGVAVSRASGRVVEMKNRRNAQPRKETGRLVSMTLAELGLTAEGQRSQEAEPEEDPVAQRAARWAEEGLNIADFTSEGGGEPDMTLEMALNFVNHGFTPEQAMGWAGAVSNGVAIEQAAAAKDHPLFQTTSATETRAKFFSYSYETTNERFAAMLRYLPNFDLQEAQLAVEFLRCSAGSYDRRSPRVAGVMSPEDAALISTYSKELQEAMDRGYLDVLVSRLLKAPGAPDYLAPQKLPEAVAQVRDEPFPAAAIAEWGKEKAGVDSRSELAKAWIADGVPRDLAVSYASTIAISPGDVRKFLNAWKPFTDAMIQTRVFLPRLPMGGRGYYMSAWPGEDLGSMVQVFLAHPGEVKKANKLGILNLVRSARGFEVALEWLPYVESRQAPVGVAQRGVASESSPQESVGSPIPYLEAGVSEADMKRLRDAKVSPTALAKYRALGIEDIKEIAKLSRPFGRRGLQVSPEMIEAFRAEGITDTDLVDRMRRDRSDQWRWEPDAVPQIVARLLAGGLREERNGLWNEWRRELATLDTAEQLEGAERAREIGERQRAFLEYVDGRGRREAAKPYIEWARTVVPGIFADFPENAPPMETLLRQASVMVEAEAEAEAEVLDVPNVRQQARYTCGPAALRAVLRFYGMRVSEDDAADEAGTSEEDGTPPEDLARTAESYGLRAELRTGLTVSDLEEAVQGGAPVIVAYQAWREKGDDTPWQQDWHDGHYAVVVGVDEDGVRVEDPSLDSGRGVIPLKEFSERWHDVDESGTRLRHLGIIAREGDNGPHREAAWWSMQKDPCEEAMPEWVRRSPGATQAFRLGWGRALRRSREQRQYAAQLFERAMYGMVREDWRVYEAVRGFEAGQQARLAYEKRSSAEESDVVTIDDLGMSREAAIENRMTA